MSRLRRFLTLTLLMMWFVLSGCQPDAEPPRLVITPFPTMTPGRHVVGELLPPADFSGASIQNPATAVAVAQLPTATPDYNSCPTRSTLARIEDTPPQNPVIVIEEMMRFLSGGGAFEELARTLTDEWGLIGESGFARNDIDFTGEGTPEFFISYTTPAGRAALFIAGCVDGTVNLLYEFEAPDDTPPTIITLGDTNRDRRNDLLFAQRVCERDDGGEIIEASCEFHTRLIAWQASDGRFANLFDEVVISSSEPRVSDFDNDEVSEIVISLENRGTSETGPLRTGTLIYDWNGEEYVLSIVQYDPPRFRIQVIHEADRAFQRRAITDSISLYQLAISAENDELREWNTGETDTLRAYAFYRLVVAQAFSGSPQYTQTVEQVMSEFIAGEFSAVEPGAVENLPPYITLIERFVESYQSGGDPRAACTAVRDFLVANPTIDAVSPLNRYGSRSPVYTLGDLCPF